jgi:hypothetical protein
MTVAELIAKLSEMPQEASIELMSLVDQREPIGDIFAVTNHDQSVTVWIEIEDMR